MKFESAPQEKVEHLQPYVDKVLLALGHPEALVTDESTIVDFRPMGLSNEEIYMWYLGVSQSLKVSVGPHHLITDLAEKLRERNEI